MPFITIMTFLLLSSACCLPLFASSEIDFSIIITCIISFIIFFGIAILTLLLEHRDESLLKKYTYKPQHQDYKRNCIFAWNKKIIRFNEVIGERYSLSGAKIRISRNKKVIKNKEIK